MKLGRLLTQGLVACCLLLVACSENSSDNTQKAPVETIKAVAKKEPSATDKQSATASQSPISKQSPAVEPQLKSASQVMAIDENDVGVTAIAKHQLNDQQKGVESKGVAQNIPLTVLDISERSFDGGNAIAVTLSTALDSSKNLADYFLLSTKQAGIIDGKPVLSENGKIVYFPFVEPNTAYKVTVYKYLPSLNGSSLKKDAFAEITTRSVKAAFSFVSKGAFLPLNQHTGLPVLVVNTPEVNVDYFKVDNDKLAYFLNRNTRFKESERRYSAQRSLENAELVYSARYSFDAPKNKRREFNLPVQSIEALNKTGVYIAVMSQPGDYYQNLGMTYFTVTDIGVHARSYNSQIEVFVNSLATQQALSGVLVELIDNKGQVLYTTKSSPQGIASIPNIYSTARYLIARKGQSTSIVPMSGPAIDMSEFELAKRIYQAQELFIYTPRDLFRPGEIVDFNALIRNQDGKRVRAGALKAVIRQPDGNIAKQFTWRSSGQGYYGQSYQIPKSAKTGLWKLEVKNVRAGVVSYPFKVEEFLPERMKITYNLGQAASFKKPQDTLTVSVLGQYLYGAPASRNRFQTKVSVRPARQPFKHLAGFEFGQLTDNSLVQNYSLPDVQLDAQGKVKLTVDNRWQNVKSPIAVNLLGSLFESGGRPVTRKHQEIVLPTGQQIGLKPHFTGNPAQNSRVMFDVITTNTEGERTAVNDLEWRLIREDRRYFWEFSDSRGWHYKWTDKEYVETSASVSTAVADVSKIEFPVEYGGYRLEVKDVSSGNISSFRFHAGRDWYRYWKNNQSGSQAVRPDKVSLAWDKEAYQAGDTAKLSIVPPKAGEAVLVIEADTPLLMKRISVPKEGVVVSVPVSKNWDRHDIYASVIHLQHGDQGQHITPSRAIGLIHLPLDRQQRKLTIDLEVDEKIYPNQTYSVKVKVQGAKNQAAKLTLAMVDVGVLSLTDFETPDPHQYFFEPRRFAVDSRDMYQKLIELNGNPLAKQRFGGDAQLSRGGKNAQADVQIVSLFSGLVEVDEQGFARVDFDIPDFNGRVKLMAVAFTDDQFGSAETEMTIAAPIVTQIAMPRFVAIGDQSTLALDIHNLTEQRQTLKVNLSAQDAIAFSDTKALALDPNEKTTLLYPIDVKPHFGRSEIALSLTGVEGFDLYRQWTITSRSAYPLLTETKKLVLEQGESFSFGLKDIEALVPETFESVLSANNNVDLNARGQLDKLLKYPYGCLEQTTSSTYPWLFASDAMIAEVNKGKKQPKTKLQSIQQGIERLQSKALNNGGFGLWSNTSPEEHWLTAYVGDFFTDAKAVGVNVPEQLFTKNMNRLRDYLKRKNGSYNNRWSRDKEHYDFAYRAYAGYVLSRHKKASLSDLRYLAKHKGQHAESALSLVHLSLALINQGDIKHGRQVLAYAKSKSRSQQYLGDYGSDIRDIALTIALLLKHEVEVKYAKTLTLELDDLLKQRRYLSTQERNAVFIAGTVLEQKYATEWQADLAINGALSTIKSSGVFTKGITASELTSPVSLTNKDNDTLFVNFSYQGVSKNIPEPVANNINIERRYYDLQGKQINPSTLTVGDLVLVKLRVDTDGRKPDVMVVDLLPAGLEIENQNLSHSIKLDDIEIDEQPLAQWVKQTKIVHQEYRDDRYVAAVDLGYRAGYLFYLARAVTPGVYKVPPPFAEDMYQPADHAIGETIPQIEIVNP